MKKAIHVPYTFVLLNWAAVVGLYQFLRYRDNLCGQLWNEQLPHATVKRHYA